MNARLKHAYEDARAALSEADQDELAGIVETYVASHLDREPDLSAEDAAELDRRLNEPFRPADPSRVEAFRKTVRG